MIKNFTKTGRKTWLYTALLVVGVVSSCILIYALVSVKGFSTDILLNPENKMHYVSLGYRNMGMDLLQDYREKINPSYKDKVWILQVENKIPELNEVK